MGAEDLRLKLFQPQHLLCHASQVYHILYYLLPPHQIMCGSQNTLFSQAFPPLHSQLHLKRTLFPLSYTWNPLLIFQDLGQASVLGDDYPVVCHYVVFPFSFCAHLTWLISPMVFVYLHHDSFVKYLLNAEFQR